MRRSGRAVFISESLSGFCGVTTILQREREREADRKQVPQPGLRTLEVFATMVTRARRGGQIAGNTSSPGFHD